MEFVGGGQVERAVGIAEIGAYRVAERAVAARDERISTAGRIVVARAIGFARSEIAAVIGAVLARCEQHVELEAAAKLW